jgi:hypothetical protein
LTLSGEKGRLGGGGRQKFLWFLPSSWGLVEESAFAEQTRTFVLFLDKRKFHKKVIKSGRKIPR